MHSHSPSSFRCLSCRVRRVGLFVLLACFAVGLLLTGPRAQGQTPDQVAAQAKATGYVTDLAGVLSQSGKDQLNALCTEVAQKTQSEIAVITIACP